MFCEQTKAISRLSETLKRAGVCMMIILCAMFLTVTTWAQSLENGTYTISNNVSHDNPVGEGMARSYTEATSDVEVNDNGIYVSLGFNNTQFMGDFTITVDGSNVSYETTTLANNMKKLKFKVPNLSTSIQVGLYVIAMDTNVVYTVNLDEGSLKLIKKAKTAPVAEESNKAESVELSKPVNQPVASTAKQDHNTSKNQVATEKPVSMQKVETQAEAKTVQTEAVQEEVKGKKTTEIEEAKAKEVVKIAEAEMKTEVQEKVQEKAEEVVEIEAREDGAENIQSTEREDIKVVAQQGEDEALENNEAVTSSNGLRMPVVIGGIVLVLIIGGLIYLKRK